LSQEITIGNYQHQLTIDFLPISGQSGAGKSYSMFGKEDSTDTSLIGIIPRATRCIIQKLPSP